MSRKSLFFFCWMIFRFKSRSESDVTGHFLYFLCLSMVCCVCTCVCVHVHICSWRAGKRLWVSYSVTHHLIPLRWGLSEPRVQVQLNCQLAKAMHLFSLNPAVVLGNRCRCWDLNSRPQACTASVYTCWTICLPLHKVVPSLMLLLIKDSSFVLVNGAQFFCAGNRIRALCMLEKCSISELNLQSQSSVLKHLKL